MGNGVSGDQGNLPSRGKRDVGTSVVKEQHYWQAEQAVAPKPEIHSLQETQKPYIVARTWGQKPEDDIHSSATSYMGPSP